ncbi:MAG: selenide, water dikinase SelD [Anaerolineales bacterium]|nr:selenide, water dikinase SelD [Anaerolineales bacterium]
MLRPIQKIFDSSDYPNLLVGLGDPDDAAVWRLDNQRALVVTTDFFTPVVDDAFDYGAIAAANSISDVYAMGGRPFLALNVAAIPPQLPAEVAGEILRGGAETARQAGVVIAGGHTIQDEEPKYGLVVLGFVDPAHMITKGGARIGDVLVLSKPLGFGTITTAIKQGKADQKDIYEVVDWMKRLNNLSAKLALECNVRGGTDITGFSLLGHALEMAQASEVGLRIQLRKVPIIQGAKRYAKEYLFPGGAFDNRLHFGSHVRFPVEIDETDMMLLFDPQTSGGLLLSVPADQLDSLLNLADQLDQPMWLIGEVIRGEGVEVVS